MQNKLLGCPCCGGEAELHGGYVSYSVICKNCNFEVFHRRTEEEVIAKWNTRKPMERIVEQLEEIYDLNDKWKKEYYEEQDWEYFDRYSNRNIGIYEAIEIVKCGVDNATN